MNSTKVPPKKTCERCGLEFAPHRFPSGRMEWPSKFAQRLFCSVTCSNGARATGDVSKECVRCGRVFTRFLADGTMIHRTIFRDQIYCGPECRTAGRRAWWTNLISQNDPRQHMKIPAESDEAAVIRLLREMDAATRAAAIEQLRWIASEAGRKSA